MYKGTCGATVFIPWCWLKLAFCTKTSYITMQGLNFPILLSWVRPCPGLSLPKRQSPWVNPNTPIQLQLQLHGPLPGLRLKRWIKWEPTLMRYSQNTCIFANNKRNICVARLLFAMFVHTLMFFQIYQYQLFSEQHMNCEDIAMSFLVANLTQLPAVWVRGEGIGEIGHQWFKADQGISSDQTHHYAARSSCVDRFVSLFGRMPLVTATSKVDKASNYWLWR
jgi:hypothetical protein